jgi:type II secretory pathway pseudopilin PulG
MFLKKLLRRKTILEFLAEILIIIIGITLSLAINNWQQNIAKNKKEQRYLQLLKNDLQTDLQDLEVNLSLRKEQLAFAQSFLNYANNTDQKPTYTLEGFTRGFYQLIINISFDANNANFEALKSTGQLDILSNETLIADLLHIYQWQYRAVQLNDSDLSAFRQNYLLPYAFKRFDFNAALNLRQKGMDLEALQNDREFLNILVYFLQSGQSAVVDYEEAIQKVSTLIDQINQQIN